MRLLPHGNPDPWADCCGKGGCKKVNIDEEIEFARENGIMNIPMIILVREGKVVNQSLGAKPKN